MKNKKKPLSEEEILKIRKKTEKKRVNKKARKAKWSAIKWLFGG